MYIFGNDKNMRGCYIETSMTTAKGAGAYLSLSGDVIGGAQSRGKGVDPFFISGISMSQHEKFSVVQCFNERNFVYAFGHDPVGSVLNVSLTTFLVNPDSQDVGDGLAQLVKWYKWYRLSANARQGSCVLTVGSRLKVEGFLVGMETSTVDAAHNLQSFVFKLLITNIQG